MRVNVGLTRLVKLAAALTAVFSLVTLPGFEHHLVVLFTHFRPQYLLASALLFLALLGLRERTLAGVMFVSFVLSASCIAPWYFAEKPAGGKTPVKLAHINVHSGNTAHERVIDFIVDEDPDIVFVQELTPEWSDGLANLPPDYQATYAVPRTDNFGIAVYSKIPFDTIRQEVSPPFGYPTIVLTATIDDMPVTFINTHPMIPLGSDLYDARNAQIASVAELVSQIDGRIVFSGDMNASLWDPTLAEFEARTGLSNVRAGSGVLPTWPTFLPLAGIPIDHAMVSSGIGVVEVRTGRRVGSDHLPLVVTLTL